jgi:hypothetical protein
LKAQSSPLQTDIVLASFHYFWWEKSVKTGEISNHTHLRFAAAAIM